MRSHLYDCQPTTLGRLLATLLVLSSGWVKFTAGETFDHGDQHCRDVSVWGDVQITEQDCQKCETEFETVCETKNETVCEMIPINSCSLVLYTECTMYREESIYNETEVVPDATYVPWECYNETITVTHDKQVPRCVDVTKQDCVTKWVVGVDGQKVWAGNEFCKPVTWRKCNLVTEPKIFNETITKCARTGTPIPTSKCELVEKQRTVTGRRCEVKKALNCECSVREECGSITYEECYETSRPISCSTTRIGGVPFQPKIHRVKCLLEDDTQSPDLSVDESAQAADERLETEITDDIREQA